MATFVDGVEVKEKKVVLTVNAFVKDGKIVEVTTGTHLGNSALKLNDETGLFEGFSNFSSHSKLPLTLDVAELGKSSVTEEVAAGMKDTDTAKFDALAFLDAHDDAEYIAALTEAEKVELQSITYLELKSIMLGSHQHGTPTTAKENAAIAIIQHEGLPKVGQAHNTKAGVGPVINAVVQLTVGDHEFNEDTEGFIAAIKPCSDGRTLYQYNWTGVNASVLDEPK